MAREQSKAFGPRGKDWKVPIFLTSLCKETGTKSIGCSFSITFNKTLKIYDYTHNMKLQATDFKCS